MSQIVAHQLEHPADSQEFSLDLPPAAEILTAQVIAGRVALVVRQESGQGVARRYFRIVPTGGELAANCHVRYGYRVSFILAGVGYHVFEELS